MYQAQLTRHVNGLTNNKYLFELQKCCGYSELMPIFKESSLAELHAMAYHQFTMQGQTLYVMDGCGNSLSIPNSPIPVRQFLMENLRFFTPIYALPDPVVYKIHMYNGCNCNSPHPVQCQSCNVIIV